MAYRPGRTVLIATEQSLWEFLLPFRIEWSQTTWPRKCDVIADGILKAFMRRPRNSSSTKWYEDGRRVGQSDEWWTGFFWWFTSTSRCGAFWRTCAVSQKYAAICCTPVMKYQIRGSRCLNCSWKHALMRHIHSQVSSEVWRTVGTENWRCQLRNRDSCRYI